MMGGKKRKILVETSAVRSLVGPTTSKHRSLFQDRYRDSRVYSSVYIRMEYVRRWVCSMITIALAVSRHRSVPEALVYLEQDFSIREVKSYLACVAEVLGQCGAMNDTRAAAEEIGRCAFHWAERFDRLLGSQIQNRSRCMRGNNQLQITSFETLMDELAQFHIRFSTPVFDCDVNDFLKMDDPRSQCHRLLDSLTEKEVSCLKTLREYVEKKTCVTCTQCERIGDLVISLEQTKSYTLVHTDNSFSHLCDARGMPHEVLPSVRGTEKLN
ncbi:hypothetical protein Pla52n_19630 [Stieleria varia]|uniref:Uncharacterized protein n=1 Tax=Stieleria varia TaxID=2528005 RepID=A0A5C6B3W7_9BACT|nr:hypothetical protein Pla52n_19630 [Stieleria varia]